MERNPRSRGPFCLPHPYRYACFVMQELDAERAALRVTQKELRREHQHLAEAKAAKQAHVAEQEAKFRDVQMLKFGKEIDVALFDTIGLRNHTADDLREALKRQVRRPLRRLPPISHNAARSASDVRAQPVPRASCARPDSMPVVASRAGARPRQGACRHRGEGESPVAGAAAPDARQHSCTPHYQRPDPQPARGRSGGAVTRAGAFPRPAGRAPLGGRGARCAGVCSERQRCHFAAAAVAPGGLEAEVVRAACSMNRSCAVTCPDAKYQRSRGHREGRVDKRKRHHVRVWSPQPAFLGLGAAEGCTLGKKP